jgi:uncharacterized membrane protein
MFFRRRRETSPIPAHPYRDSALVYAGMGGVIIVVATLTGGSFVKAFGVAVLFFLVATAWTWWGYRRRIQAREAERAAAAARSTGGKPGPGANGSTNGNGNGRKR